MSSSNKPRLASFKAGSDLSSKQFTFVKLTAEDTVDSQSSKGGAVIGILMNAPLAGDFAEVAMAGGGAKLKIGTGGCSLMDNLISATDGSGIIGDAAGQRVGAQALNTAVVGDVISVDVVSYESQA